MNSLDDDFSTSEVTFGSVSEEIKQVTKPILRRVAGLYAVVASQNEFETTGNTEATNFS